MCCKVSDICGHKRVCVVKLAMYESKTPILDGTVKKGNIVKL